LIENIEEIIKLIEDSRWDEARELARGSPGALQAINAIKNLTRNGVVEKEDLEKIKGLKPNILNMIQSRWLSEFDVEYFTLIFAYIEHANGKIR